MTNSTLFQRMFLWCSALLLSGALGAQVTVTGKVTSAVDGTPLPGASIQEKGTRNGTVANVNGEFSLSVASRSAVLVVSYTGYLRTEVPVSTDGPMAISIEEDLSSLSDVVVSTTRVPVRKVESITAITTLGPKQLEAARPEGIAEAVFGTPGVYSNFAQGRFRGAIYTRGFPDGTGNGLVYTGIMIDGLPALASTSRPPDFAFGMDPNVERVEIVRGNAATLFGRAAAAGVVNIITRTGGSKLGGTVRQTFYNDNTPDRGGIDFKTDVNLNGPIGKAKNLRFNIGGFYLYDNGFRDMGAPDKGYQFRANFDYFLPKKLGRVRVYGQRMDITIQNNIDLPFRVSDQRPKDGWKITDSYYHEALDTIFYTVTNKQGQQETRSIRKSHEEGNYARGGNAGMEVSLEFGKGWTINNHLRYQSYDHGTKFNLGVSPTYTDAPVSLIRVLVDGDGNDTELMNELRITKTIESATMRHRFTIGGFYTHGLYTPTTYSLTGWSNTVKDSLTFRRIGPPTLPAPSTGSQARIDEYDVTVMAVFFGDEMKFGDRLNVNAGVRYDQIDMNIKGFYTTNPPAPNINRDEKHSDWSASIGANYLLSGRSAIYGSIVRAYRMPDYDAYSPARPNSLTTNPRIVNNEIIYNYEVGARAGLGDLSADLALFHTRINNRLATIYDGPIATQKPLGTNQIFGTELSLIYAPRAIRGLLLQAAFTLQKATFVDFKIPVTLNSTTRKPNLDVEYNLYGNKVNLEGIQNDTVKIYSIDLRGKQLPTVPSTIFNFTANYDHKFFNLNVTGTWNGNVYADATNVFKMEDFILVNAGVMFKVPLKGAGSLRAGVLGKNLLNRIEALRAFYFTDNDNALVLRQRVDKGILNPERTYFMGIPAQPRRILFTLEYRF